MKKEVSTIYNELKNKLWLFLFTQAIVPFDTVIAFYFMYGGISGIFKIGIISDTFANALGFSLALAFNIWYTIAGALFFFAIGFRRRDIQSFALVSIIAQLLIRIVVISWSSGLSTSILGLYILNSAFIVACIVRLYMLSKYEFVLKLISQPTVKADTNGK